MGHTFEKSPYIIGLIVVQAALVALEGKDIVGVLVDDLRGDVALTAHGVDGQPSRR